MVVPLLVSIALLLVVLAALAARHRVLSGRLAVLDEAVRAAADERDRLGRELDRVGSTDAATGLGNRSRMEAELPRLLAQADERLSSVGVVLIEMDGLRAYEESNGALATERLVRSAVATWSELLRHDDRLLRLDEEAFAALLPGCSIVNAERVAARLADAAGAECRCSAGAAAWDGS
ncbi:MAG TPA: diguanylate cyclase, partial [Solirubrobacteraceae bacterium]|nr:diguanylate cyclase [Solirubrobacteraceae bacterium]